MSRANQELVQVRRETPEEVLRRCRNYARGWPEAGEPARPPYLALNSATGYARWKYAVSRPGPGSGEHDRAEEPSPEHASCFQRPEAPHSLRTRLSPG